MVKGIIHVASTILEGVAGWGTKAFIDGIGAKLAFQTGKTKLDKVIIGIGTYCIAEVVGNSIGNLIDERTNTIIDAIDKIPPRLEKDVDVDAICKESVELIDKTNNSMDKFLAIQKGDAESMRKLENVIKLLNEKTKAEKEKGETKNE